MCIINKKLEKSLLAFSLVVALGSCSKQIEIEQGTSMETESEQVDPNTVVAADNPFFKAYTTPFQVPPFSKIKDEHYMPAFEKGMEEHLTDINNIVNNPASPTFKNTIEELERSGKLLSKVQRVFYNLAGSNTNPKMQELQRELSPLISAHYDKISLNKALFERVERLYQTRDSLALTAEQLKLLEDTRKGFVRSGALLSEHQKAEITNLNSQLSQLTTEYGQNLLAETNGFELILDESDLAGLSNGVIQAASTAAKQKLESAETDEEKAKYQEKYVFTPHRSSMYPFLTESSRRDLRETLYKAYIDRGNNDNANDNKTVAAKIAQLRAQHAHVMGYETHAHFVLEERMVKTPEDVYNLLMQLWQPALARAKQEVADMQEVVDAEGHDFNIAAWDWWQYSEKVRKAKYEIDEASLKPYLSLDNVLKGVFDTSNKLWGLTFTELHDIDVYHPDARVWEVKDKDGSHLGIFIGDYFTRSNKRGGAWMSSFKGQSNLDGVERPVVVNVCNFPGPVGDDPALLSFEDVTTLFHEFGHALHGLLTNTTYQSMSGTSGPRDFTEFPAQILEHWAKEPAILKTFATHYITGDVIPDELISKLLKASKFNQGFSNTEYLAASLLDMDWHTLKADDELQDTAQFEKSSMEKIGLIDEIAPRYRSTYFSHIFASGYAAGYYSYVHSAVLDSDGFAAFKETGDVFNPELAEKLRAHIYEKGSTEDAMTLYKKFRGREPQIEALLKIRGLDGSVE
ncbi:Dipeptidyl carboxypeptidase [Alteromonas sp. 38]|uniref:M3 family metallopeptidase n=1 Tax=unclassified Alteromonas TaxID=2614992 RepID=UPI0012F392A1|nr:MULTISPECIES: M3 family metallopeptidase [unclassified Alteromonas]CAD5253952.1 Dipeptidyl carboxypeptidase [Alteromonas sp. 154]VXB06569.1 Dipeptidyl carboxypeptidase [Alteromonas sp. 38]